MTGCDPYLCVKVSLGFSQIHPVALVMPSLLTTRVGSVLRVGSLMVEQQSPTLHVLVRF